MAPVLTPSSRARSAARRQRNHEPDCDRRSTSSSGRQAGRAPATGTAGGHGECITSSRLPPEWLSMYCARADELKPVGEVGANGVAAMTAGGGWRHRKMPGRLCNLALGSAVGRYWRLRLSPAARRLQRDRYITATHPDQSAGAPGVTRRHAGGSMVYEGFQKLAVLT